MIPDVVITGRPNASPPVHLDFQRGTITAALRSA